MANCSRTGPWVNTLNSLYLQFVHVLPVKSTKTGLSSLRAAPAAAFRSVPQCMSVSRPASGSRNASIHAYTAPGGRWFLSPDPLNIAGSRYTPSPRNSTAKSSRGTPMLGRSSSCGRRYALSKYSPVANMIATQPPSTRS